MKHDIRQDFSKRLEVVRREWFQLYKWFAMWGVYYLFILHYITLHYSYGNSFILVCNYLVFNKATWTLSRKKIVQKPPYNWAGCIVEPYNASRQPKFQFCQKVGKGRHVYVRTWPRPSRSAWAETLQTHGFPVQTYGETSKGRNFDSKAWIKIPQGQISSFDPFCVPM